jgi:riboflavin kinase / FMN adenylyltransferase
MRILHGLTAVPADTPAAVVALGVFDGIHLGHREILTRAVSRARRSGLTSVACTFDRHPMEILRPERAPLPITTLEERLALMAATGLDTTLVLPFTRELAAVEPEAFVRDVLSQRLHARAVVVGTDHRFGRGARGDARLLEMLGSQLGFAVEVVVPLEIDGAPVSSTEIRGALGRGDVERAARLLGRPYSACGEVVRGAGRGRTLGFPTANLKTDRPLLIPTGVYACRARFGQDVHRAMVNVGHRPTFEGQDYAIEAYLLDFTGDMYDHALCLDFHRRVRDEQKFASVEALREQIARDVELARTSL